MFATNGAAFASVLPWYPTLKDQWQLSDTVFGLLVACFAAGSLASSVLPAWAEQRFGPRGTVLVGSLLLALAAAAVGVLPGPGALALLLLFFGACDAIVDVSQNVIGVRVQDELGRSLLSSLHACWSLGAVAGSMVATFVATRGVAMSVHLGAAALGIGALVLLAAWLIGPVPRSNGATADSLVSDPLPDTARRARLPRILWLALPVALVAGAGTIVEDVANNWAGLAAVTFAGVDLAAAGGALSVVLGAQMIGRFTGDLFINRYGRVLVARVGGIFIASGGALVVLATAPASLYFGLAFVGFGCATLVPSAYAAAARLPEMRPSDGVTAVSWLMRLSFLTASPLIGAVAGWVDLRVALGVLILAGARRRSAPQHCAPGNRDW